MSGAPRLRFSERARRARLALAAAWPQMAFTTLMALLLAAHQGGLAKYIYVAGALAVAWRVQRRDPAGYVGFLVWLWFLTPFVRRVADLYGGWQDPSLILLTPYLATGLSLRTFVERLVRQQGEWRARPVGLAMFAFAAAGTAIGIPLGFLRMPTTAVLETFNYITPLCLGGYIAMQPELVRRIEQRVVVTFERASLVAGVYGIYQFTTAPPWDVAWMVNSEMSTIGRPEPFAIRVFSTMHGPGVLGAFLAVALVLWVARPRAWAIPAAGAAGVTLLLSQVRSAWVAFIVGSLLVVAALKPAQKMRVGILVLLAVMSVGTLLMTPEMSEMVNDRIATFEQLDEDTSGLARVTGHEMALDLVTHRLLGLGIGQTDRKVEGYISMRDSTIVAGLLQFGLFGAPLYFLAVWLATVQMGRYYWRASTPEGMALACGGLGLVAIAPLGVVSAGPMGICFWLVAGLAVADRHLARVRQAGADMAVSHRPRLRSSSRDPIPA